MLKNDEKYGESKCNYLLIRFVHLFFCILDSRVLDGCFTAFANPADCFALLTQRLAMTKCGDSCGLFA